MTPEERWHQTPDGLPKRPYDSKALARRAIKASGMTRTGTMRAYMCPTCDQWHIGNSTWRSA